MLNKEEVLEHLKPVCDPEIHLSVVDLGLIYDVGIEKEEKINIKMTLTTPACPYGPMLIEQIQSVAGRIPGVKEAKVDLVWEPPWDPKTMATEEIRLMLGLI